MDISARMRQILLVLLQEERPISVKLLAEQIGVSKRTAQRELEYMESTRNVEILHQKRPSKELKMEKNL